MKYNLVYFQVKTSKDDLIDLSKETIIERFVFNIKISYYYFFTLWKDIYSMWKYADLVVWLCSLNLIANCNDNAILLFCHDLLASIRKYFFNHFIKFWSIWFKISRQWLKKSTISTSYDICSRYKWKSTRTFTYTMKT